MFFRKKIEETGRQLSGKLQAVDERIEKGNEELGERFSSVSKGMDQLLAAMRKQDMAIEDLLETWEEKQAGERELEKRVLEYQSGETRFLELFWTYEEQFQRLKRFAKKEDAAWAEQFALMEEELERSRKLCGFSVIGECGGEVDYDLHEVLRAVDTEEEEKAGQIAEVYRSGYLYKGAVGKKAQVAAYRSIQKKMGERENI